MRQLKQGTDAQEAPTTQCAMRFNSVPARTFEYNCFGNSTDDLIQHTHQPKAR